MKLLGVFDVTDEGVLTHKWPTQIVVNREYIESPPPRIAIGRHGAINVSVKNGYAHYWRTQDVVGGWMYRLEYSTYQDPVPA